MSEARAGHNSAGTTRTVQMDEELLAFVRLNCDTNLRLMLATLQEKLITSPDLLMQLVGHIENFKKLKKAVEEAR